jgi:hypothetical protein
MTMGTKDDRALFFDLLPLGFKTQSVLLVFSIAVNGHGVFKQVLTQVYTNLDRQDNLLKEHMLDCQGLIKAIMGNVSFLETER